MNRSMLAIASTVSLLVFSASAAPGRYWIQSGGTYDGDWTDLNHWEGGLEPSAGVCTYFRDAVEGTVNVNTNAETGYWVISAKDELPRTAVTWTGSGSLTNTATAVTWIGQNRQLTIDGPDIYVHRTLQLNTNAVLDVRSGHLRAQSLSLMEETLVVQSGGFFQPGAFTFADDSLLRLAGGVLQLENGLTLTNLTCFSHEGGTLQLTNGQINKDSWSLLPKDGTTLDVRFAGKSANAVYVDTNFSTNIINGTLYVTNRTVAAYPHQRYHSQKAHHTVLGTGSLYLDAFGVRGGYSITIAGPRLFLGVGLDGESSADGIYYKFPQGISFGSWGDWSNDVGAGTVSGDGGMVSHVQFAGDVSFDTRDCFDGATVHHVRLLKCSDLGMTSLRVAGGGSVDLAFESAVAGLNELVVEDGTVLYLTNMTANVTVENVRIGNGAALRLGTSLVGCKSIETGTGAVLDAPNQAVSLDGLKELNVGDGATLDLTAALMSPVRLYRLTLGAGAILGLPLASGGVEVYRLNCAADSKVIFSGEPTGTWLVPVWSAWDAQGTPPTVEVCDYDTTKWDLRNAEGVLYLADESTKPDIYDCGKQVWLGANSTLWSEGANWKDGSIPNGSTYCSFDLNPSSYVTNDFAVKIRYPIVYENAGPYFFRGNGLELLYGDLKISSNTIRHQGKFPAVFEMPLSFTGAIPYLRSTGSSYIAMTNGCSMVERALYVTGDVRLGGEWGCTNMLPFEVDDVANGVTVYPNSTLTLTASGEEFPAFENMVIDGTFDVSNTLTSVATANWLGEGAVKLHAVATDETAAFALREKLTLYPEAGWTTVAAETPDAAVTIAASDTPTLGATCDWTYGPAADAEPTTTAADRALTVVETGVLTIDTEDPVTGEGHVVTFTDPIVAPGKVVKTGAGTLVLASDANAIGELVVEKGAIAIPVAQTLNKVSFAADATLALTAEQGAAAEGGWTTVLTAKSVTGLGDTLEGGRYKLRTLAVDGLTVVQAKAKSGLGIIVR